MSTFINSDVTNNGKNLIAKGYLGQRINFTRIVMGDGYLPEGTIIADMNNVIHAVVNVDITKKKINGDGTVVIGGEFSNADIQTEFFYRELALFAEGEDGLEVLYCYGNAGDFAERITPVGGSSVVEKAIDIVTAIGTAQNVTANIVRTTTADGVAYDDSRTGIGAASVQEAVEILAQNSVTTMIISDTEPTEPCEVWLKPTGVSEFPPEGEIDPEERAAQNTGNGTPLYFYLAHYYDKAERVFKPFMYTSTAANVLLTPGGAETVAEVIAQLQESRVQTTSDLFAHIGNTAVHTTAGQMDNIFTALGELIIHVEDMGIHVSSADKTYWSGAVTTAEEALTVATAAAQAAASMSSRIDRLEDSLFNDITGNPFSISFDDLDGITLTKGIWNKDRQRIEC